MIGEKAGRVADKMLDQLRGGSVREWVRLILLLLLGAHWLFSSSSPPAESRIDLKVTSITFDSADTWDWTTMGCTVGPRVRLLAHVKNVGNEPTQTGEATIRFVGKPAAGTDADVLVFEEPIRSIATSRRTDEATIGPTVTLPEAFLTRHSVWTATVIHPDDVNSKNDTVKDAVLNPCRQRASE